MTKAEMIEKIREFMVANMDGDIKIVALRYDNIKRTVGEELDRSRANWEREDSREFVEYDENYDGEYLAGTSCYLLTDELDYLDTEKEIDELLAKKSKLIVGSDKASWSHCSLVVGNEGSTADVEDEGEILMDYPKVAVVLF